MTREEEILEHIDALMELAGLDKSESATATFVELLDEAVIKAREVYRKSAEEDGLCFDCRWIIAETLLNWNEPQPQEKEVTVATLLRTDGTASEVHPSDGKQWTSADLHTVIGGCYGISRTAEGNYLLAPDTMELHEQLDKDSLSFEELCRWKPFNTAAAKATGYDEGHDWVFGDALLIPKAEIPATPENLKLFGDWNENTEAPQPMIEYACQDDECGIVFYFGNPGKHFNPNFCPSCGEENPLPLQSMMTKRSIDHQGIKFVPGHDIAAED